MARPKAGGEVLYLGRVRWQPGQSVALDGFLRRLAAAGQEEKLALLRGLLEGSGYQPGQAEPEAAAGEDDETAALLAGLLN